MAAQQIEPLPSDLRCVTRAVVWNQALWTAGASLTTGGFLVYFGKELGASGFKIALLLAIPETVGIFGLLGGLWLDSLRTSEFLIELGTYRFESFQLLFLISWIGRFTAAFWILPIREPETTPMLEESLEES